MSSPWVLGESLVRAALGLPEKREVRAKGIYVMVRMPFSVIGFHLPSLEYTLLEGCFVHDFIPSA